MITLLTTTTITTSILQAISSVGFPIVMCGILCWYIPRENDRNRVTIDKMSDALNNNTNVLVKLLERLDKE